MTVFNKKCVECFKELELNEIICAVCQDECDGHCGL
jgi:hypothetical protein